MQRKSYSSESLVVEERAWEDRFWVRTGNIQVIKVWSIFCWWECKVIQPLWEKFWQFLLKLNIYPLSGVALILLFVLVAKLCAILATPWTVARQAPLSMGLSRQEYWSRLPLGIYARKIKAYGTKRLVKECV